MGKQNELETGKMRQEDEEGLREQNRCLPLWKNPVKKTSRS
jgi:hypothetical protein